MGVNYIKNIALDCKIGLWDVEESYEQLLEMTYLEEEDIQRLLTFKNINRRRESLSVRALLQQMADPCERVIYKNASRKPFVKSGKYNISLSHSTRKTAILLAPTNIACGIDLEYMHHDIKKLESFFLNADEYITNDKELHDLHVYIHWCAKEVLFKICDKVDINFQKNLTIQAFEPNRKGGSFHGLVQNNFRNESFAMYYEIFDNYVMVYCIKDI